MTDKKRVRQNINTDTPFRCRECGSSERTAYLPERTRELAYPGIDENGQHFTHTVWRNTACTQCGQQRVDITRDNRPL